MGAAALVLRVQDIDAAARAIGAGASGGNAADSGAPGSDTTGNAAGIDAGGNDASGDAVVVGPHSITVSASRACGVMLVFTTNPDASDPRT
jgi:hypothetical protein